MQTEFLVEAVSVTVATPYRRLVRSVNQSATVESDREISTTLYGRMVRP